jgi:glycerol uptake facilitator-like aquaporin
MFMTSMAAGQEGLGNLLTVALCFGLAIALAVTFAGPISGGHLSPGMTIAFALFKGFPWRKAPHYILAQLLGAFLGCLAVYAQFAPAFEAMTAKMRAAGQDIFTPAGPPGIIALLPPSDNMGIILVNEILATATLAAAIFCVLDPSNVFVTPGSTPLLLGIMFFIVVVCWAPNGVALNTARDLGSRFAMGCIYGRGVFPPKYTAFAALANLLGTQIGALFQLLFLSDTVRPATPGAVAAAQHLAKIEEGHTERELTKVANGYTDGMGVGRILSGKFSKSSTGKDVESV